MSGMRIVSERHVPDKLFVVDNESLRQRWAAPREHCQVCLRHRLIVGGLQTHHLSGGAGRSDEPVNFLRVCKQCHDRIHLEKGNEAELTLSMQLAAKMLADVEDYDPRRVMLLKGQVQSVDLLLDVAMEATRMKQERGEYPI